MQASEPTPQCFVPNSFRRNPTGSGPLSGTTFVVKDLFALSGHTTSFGHSKWRETHQPSNENAPVIDALLNAGSELVGVTKMDQLAYSLVGNVGEGVAPLNPLYPDRFTGGSSSGSAAAVAGEIADIGMGTDTGGSIRIPAAACGLYSIRPTHGRISSKGVTPLAQSFDVVGLCARDPQLLARVFEQICVKPQPIEPTQKVLIIEASLKLVDLEVTEAVQAVADQLARHLGVLVERVIGTELVNASVGDLLARLQAREIWRNHGDWVMQNQQFLAEDVQTRLENARKRAEATETEKVADKAVWDTYRRHFAELVPSRTIVVMPVMESLPPSKDSTPDQLSRFRNIAFGLSAIGSLTGAPELVVPWKHPMSGLTYGVGFLGSSNQD